jgi:hypothetical protein
MHNADVLLALLLLGGWKMQALECKRLGEAERFAVAEEDPGSMGRLELIVSSDVKVKDEDLNINAPLKDVMERLRNEASFRDFIVRYFTVDLIYKIISECNEDLEKKFKQWKEETEHLLKNLKIRGKGFDGKELVPEV